jgi:ubiquinone biosynthesis protein UbiJ
MPATNPLLTPAIAAINHLLAQEAWARDALRLHAGKIALIDTGALALRMRVTADGMADGASEDDGSANVTIRLKLADLPLMAQNRERAFSYVKIEGDAEFANTISKLSRGLRWEAEHDLEPFIGTIAATRVVRTARDAAAAFSTTNRKLAENVAEFLTEEQPMLVKPAEMEAFGNGVARLRDDVDRAAKRLAKLEKLLEQQQQLDAE